MKPDDVSKAKRSVRGKKYSELTFDEWTVLFKGSPSAVDTICPHNGIIDDSGIPSGHLPNFPPNAEVKEVKKVAKVRVDS